MLSSATVVVEAGRRSGALNTAHHALDAGLPVGIVPGPITSAASAGCHAFLRDKPATCVTSVAEIMQLAFEGDGVLDIPDPVEPGRPEQLAPDDPGAGAPRADPLLGRVLDALRPRRGQTASEIARSVGEGTSRIHGALGMLDLDGVAVLGADGLWRRAPAPRPAREKSSVASTT